MVCQSASLPRYTGNTNLKLPKSGVENLTKYRIQIHDFFEGSILDGISLVYEKTVLEGDLSLFYPRYFDLLGISANSDVQCFGHGPVHPTICDLLWDQT